MLEVVVFRGLVAVFSLVRRELGGGVQAGGVVSSSRWTCRVPSVVGLLEERELAVRGRVEQLREEADRSRPRLVRRREPGSV
jgi:hypothetical protein